MNNLRDMATLKMYILVAFCVLSTVSALPTPEKLHETLQEPFFLSEGLSPLADYFLKKHPNIDIHNIKLKCLKNDLSQPLPEICSELFEKGFYGSNFPKENNEKESIKGDFQEIKADEPVGENTTTAPSYPDKKEEEKDSKEESVPVAQVTTNKPGSEDKDSREDFNGINVNEEKETFEPLEPDQNKKPFIFSIFSPFVNLFDKITSHFKSKSKSNFDTPRSFYIIEIETDS